jgi:branched-chain amino acid transport system ATP-binding protein
VSGALDIRHLSVEIAGSPVLTDVILSIAPGAFVGLVGRNGAGKTTLMRAIMGLLPVRSGEMKFLDRDLRATPPHHRSGFDIGYMPEDRRLVPELTVEENVLMPAWANGDPAVAARLAFVYGILPEVKGMAPRRALQLSGGQQKLVALARALMCGRRLLLLDEPFEGVAPALAGRLVEAIAAFKATGVSMLLSESDYVHSSDLIDSLYVIERGVVTPRPAVLKAESGR